VAKKQHKQDLGLPIPHKLVELILLGHAEDGRQLQDSPLLGDVWLAYADDPAKSHDLLITPHMECTAGQVAKHLRSSLNANSGRGVHAAAEIAYLHGIVVAKLNFEDVLRVVVPGTLWWHDKELDRRLANLIKTEEPANGATARPQEEPTRSQRPITRDSLRAGIVRLARVFARKTPDTDGETADFDVVERFLILSALILWARRLPRSKKAVTDESLELESSRAANKVVEGLLAVLQKIPLGSEPEAPPGIGTPRDPSEESSRKLIFSVSLNRRALPAIALSVPAVKADAARLLFKVNCEKIAWAVVDSGIDDHKAFESSGKSRIRRSFDFTRIRKILSFDQTPAANRNKVLAEITAETKLSDQAKENPDEVERILKELAEDAEDGHPHRWDLIEQFVSLENPPRPNSEHGTHVAGIIGAGPVPAQKEEASGMCPDIQLYDFRVLAKNMDDTEFAIIAALQYIRYVNELHSYITIHGANLSLSIPHNVRNFACGRTPLCKECERLVESGVVVVAAAGNRGYQSLRIMPPSVLRIRATPMG
jgi:hypothetical protein